jgi:hypothetical protein
MDHTAIVKYIPTRVIAILLFVSANCAAIGAAADSGIDQFNIANDGDAILVPVDVNGVPTQFIVDTGSARTAIDEVLLHTPPIRERKISASTGERTIHIYDVPHATLRKHDLSSELSWVVGMDLKAIREASGGEIYGILGMDFLGKKVLQFNFDKGEFSICEKTAVPDGTDWVPVKINDQGQPIVRGRISNWSEEDFIMDTGLISQNSGQIERRLCDYLLRIGQAEIVGSADYQSLVGIAQPQKLVKLKGLELGKQQLSDLIFAQHEDANTLDLAYLSRYNLTIDFPGHRMFFSPSKGFEKPDLKNLSGLHLAFKDKKFIVDSLSASGAASKSGIRNGDQIVRIANRSTDGLSMFELQRMLSQENEALSIGVKRGGNDLPFTLKLTSGN